MISWQIPDGELQLIPDFLPSAEADRLLMRLRTDLAWAEERLRIAGRELLAPRLVCWYGDPGARYRYSGRDHDPLPWTPVLLEVKERVEQWTGRRFNSALGNLYRSGEDSMGWHADKEKALGPEPFIASVSVGAPRRFELRHVRSGQRVHVELGHGSLLLMGGALQKHWRHRLPKMPGLLAGRINLTFRDIVFESTDIS